MDEARLLSLLAEARQQEPAPQARTVLAAHPGELTFARARALALDPRRCTEAERNHLLTCPPCRRLADRCYRLLPHPSWWTLLDDQRSQLDSSHASYLKQHLRDCRLCGERRAAAADLGPAVVGITLPGGGPGRWDSGAPEFCGAHSADDRLHADLIEEQGHLAVRVRTRDAQLAALPFAGRFLGPRGSIGPARYVLLRWHTTGFDTVFDSRAWPSADPLHGVEIAPVDLRFLSLEDRAELLESIRLGDASTRAAWRACLEPLTATFPDLCPMLRAASAPGFVVPALTEPDRVQRLRHAGGAE
jgi:hypothetical protein